MPLIERKANSRPYCCYFGYYLNMSHILFKGFSYLSTGADLLCHQTNTLPDVEESLLADYTELNEEFSDAYTENIIELLKTLLPSERKKLIKILQSTRGRGVFRNFEY
jgi:hypothetical protein